MSGVWCLVSGFWVQGFGKRVWGKGFGVKGLGLGFGVWCSGLGVEGSGAKKNRKVRREKPHLFKGGAHKGQNVMRGKTAFVRNH